MCTTPKRIRHNRHFDLVLLEAQRRLVHLLCLCLVVIAVLVRCNMWRRPALHVSSVLLGLQVVLFVSLCVLELEGDMNKDGPGSINATRYQVAGLALVSLVGCGAFWCGLLDEDAESDSDTFLQGLMLGLVVASFGLVFAEMLLSVNVYANWVTVLMFLSLMLLILLGICYVDKIFHLRRTWVVRLAPPSVVSLPDRTVCTTEDSVSVSGSSSQLV